MDNFKARLADCFRTVFPDLPEADIPAASQESVSSWDSVATVTLINVIEDEFKVPMDLERLAEFDSFERIHEHLRRAIDSPNLQAAHE